MQYLKISVSARIIVPAMMVSVMGLTFATVPADASTYYYASWTGDTLSSSVNGSASGTLTTPQGTLNISYSGDVVSSTQVNNIGTDFYSSWQSVYTNSTVSNSPTNVDIIALSEAQAYTDTLTFSSPVTNPIVDIVSLGASGNPVSYIFSAAPVLLSQGSASWGGCATCLSVSGNTLTGTEGDGVLEFNGTFSTLSWTTTGGENWNGFTVGVAGEAPVGTTPEPDTWVFFLLAVLLSTPYLTRRNSRTEVPERW